MKVSNSLGAGRAAGFTLAEITVAVAVFSMVSLALLMASTALQRSFSAVNDYATDHAAQLRLSDYLSRDLRRSISVGTLNIPNSISMVVPQYMPTPAPSPTPAPTPYTPQLDGKGGVYYSALTLPAGTAMSSWLSNCTVTISYWLDSTTGIVYRQEGSAAPVALADNAQDFVFTETAADSGKVVETRITFRPSFVSSGASANAITATTFHNRTLLRNNATIY